MLGYVKVISPSIPAYAVLAWSPAAIPGRPLLRLDWLTAAGFVKVSHCKNSSGSTACNNLIFSLIRNIDPPISVAIKALPIRRRSKVYWAASSVKRREPSCAAPESHRFRFLSRFLFWSILAHHFTHDSSTSSLHNSRSLQRSPEHGSAGVYGFRAEYHFSVVLCITAAHNTEIYIFEALVRTMCYK